MASHRSHDCHGNAMGASLYMAGFVACPLADLRLDTPLVAPLTMIGNMLTETVDYRGVAAL